MTVSLNQNSKFFFDIGNISKFSVLIPYFLTKPNTNTFTIMGVTNIAKKIADASLFQNFVIGVIIFAGILVGTQTYHNFYAIHVEIIDLLDAIVLTIFTIEVIIKLVSEFPKPWKYFADPWNVFDFLIVGVCFIPFEGEGAAFLPVLRLARILRVFKLVTALPKLQLIVGALLKSIPSMGYVVMLLLLHFYIFASASVFFFGRNDPWHFGNLQHSMLSLFRGVTFEDWTDLMYIQMYGSDHYGYNDEMRLWANENGFEIVSSASGMVAAVFFCIFVVSGGLIILNLFIGVIMTGMDEMKAEAELDALVAQKRSDGSFTLNGEMDILANKIEELATSLELIKVLMAKAHDNAEKLEKDKAS